MCKGCVGVGGVVDSNRSKVLNNLLGVFCLARARLATVIKS